MQKLLAVVITSLVLAAACGGADSDTDPQVARDALVDHLHSRAASVASVGLGRGLEEMLPNVQFQPPNGEALRPIRLAVVGDVVGVEPGRAFRNGPRGSAVAASELESFDDAAADWRSLHLRIDVDESLGDDVDPGPLRVGLAISGGEDPRVLMDGAEALGRVVLLLDDTTGVFDYDPTLLGMVLGGEYLMTVDDDGTLRFPVLEPDVARDFQGELRTIDDLRRAAAEPTKVIPVAEPSPGFYVRIDAQAAPADAGG